jgi:hypothetical protein
MKIDAVSAAKLIGISVTSLSTVFASFFFIDNRYAHQVDMTRNHIELQVRSNMMYLEARRAITESEIKRIADVITMYENRQLISGVLDAADQRRLSMLRADLDAATQERNNIKETIEAMRLETRRISELSD